MLFFALPYAARANKPNVGAATSRAMHAVRPTQANHEIVRHVGISKMLDRFEKGFGFAFHDANLAWIGYCFKYVNAQIRTLPRLGACGFRDFRTDFRNSFQSI